MKKMREAVKAPLLMLVIYILLAASSSLTWLWGKDEQTAFASAMVLQILIFVLPTLFYCKLTGLSLTKKLSLRMFAPGKAVLIIGLLGVMLFGSLTVSLLWSTVVGVVADGSVSASSAADSITSMNPVYVILTFCIVPAVCEEFVFRGVMLSEYVSYGPCAAIIITSVLFAMAHFSFAELPARIFCGVVLAASVYMVKSLYASVILHLANNIMSVYLLPYIKRVVLQPRGVLFSVFIVTTLFLAFAVVVFREAEGVYFEYAYDPDFEASGMSGKAPGKKNSAVGAFFSPTLIICVLFFVIAAIV